MSSSKVVFFSDSNYLLNTFPKNKDYKSWVEHKTAKVDCLIIKGIPFIFRLFREDFPISLQMSKLKISTDDRIEMMLQACELNRYVKVLDKRLKLAYAFKKKQQKLQEPQNFFTKFVARWVKKEDTPVEDLNQTYLKWDKLLQGYIETFTNEVAKREPMATDRSVLVLKKSNEIDEIMLKIYKNPSLLDPNKAFFLSASRYLQEVKLRSSIRKFLKEKGLKHYGKKTAKIAIPVLFTMGLPYLSKSTMVNQSMLGRVKEYWKGWFAPLFDKTPIVRQDVDDYGRLIFDSSGNPVTYTTSAYEQTIVLSILVSFIGMPTWVPLTYSLGSKVKSTYQELRNYGEFKKYAFAEYFKWIQKNVEKLTKQHAIPKKYEKDPVISKYKCSLSGEIVNFPMRSPSEDLYEHFAILQHLLKSNKDPRHPNKKLLEENLIFDQDVYETMRTRICALEYKEI